MHSQKHSGLMCVLYQDSDRASYSLKKITFLFILEENLDDDKFFYHIHKKKKRADSKSIADLINTLLRLKTV